MTAVILSMKYLVVLFSSANCFNLDNSSATVFSGQSRSRAGFSVDTWKTLNGSYQVVFGAPNWQPDNRTIEVYMKGAVHCCTWTKPISCDKITMHSDGIPNTKINTEDLSLLNYTDAFSAGFGETLFTSSNSSYLLLCAPRYLFGVRYWPGFYRSTARGACFLTQNVASQMVKILPLKKNKFTKKNGGPGYATSGLAGISALITKDMNVFIGVPFLFLGQGATFTFDANDVIRRRDRNIQFRQSQEYPDNRNPNELIYKGFSMAKGYFDGIQESVAVSQPGVEMGSDHGYYRLARKGSKVVFYTSRNVQRELPLRPGLLIRDEERLSKFGFSMTAGDFNGDDHDDLVVSAPFSSADDTFATKATDEDAGKVYIFYNPLKEVNGQQHQTLMLNGFHRRSHFGYSVFCPGDLNGDGISDLIIGAPQDDLGAIYIYNGAHTGLISTPTQVIRSRDHPINIGHGFGFSIGGGHDVDLNGFPDIVVGAIRSDSAVLIRTAPVIDLHGEVYFNKSGQLYIGLKKCNTPLAIETYCFNLTINITYSSLKLKNEVLAVKLDIILDKYHSPTRLFYQDHSRRFEIPFNITNRLDTKNEAFNLTVYLEPRLKPEDLDGIVHTRLIVSPPLRYVDTRRKKRFPKTKTSRISEDGTDGTDGTKILAVLNKFETAEFQSEVRMVYEKDFLKPNLIMTVNGSKFIDVGVEKVIIILKIVSKIADSHQIKLLIKQPLGFHISDDVCYSVDLQQDRKLIEEQGYTSVICKIADNFKLDKENIISIKFEQDLIQFVHSIKEGLKFKFEFFVKSLTDTNYPLNGSSIWIEPLLKSNIYLSSLANPESVVATANYSRALEQQFLNIYHTDRYNFTKLSSLKNLGIVITHRFTIENEGPSPIPRYNISIFIPMEFMETKWLPLAAFLSPVNTSGYDISCSKFNPKVTLTNLDLLQVGDTRIRKERSTTKARSRQPYQDIMKMECQNNQKIRCQIVTCYSNLLKPKSRDEIEFTVVIPYFILKKIGRDQFTFNSTITVNSLGKMYTHDSETSVNVDFPVNLKSYLFERWWILLATFVCGIIVIHIIAFILYKVGFFERTKRDQLITKKQEHRKSMRLSPTPATEETYEYHDKFME